MPHYDKTQPINYKNQLFSSTNQVQIHHQSSTLHFCYNNGNGNGNGNGIATNKGPNTSTSSSKAKWFYQGTTTLYLSLDTSSPSTTTNNNNANNNTNNNNANDNEKKKKNLNKNTTTTSSSNTNTQNDKNVNSTSTAASASASAVQMREIALHLRHGKSITITNAIAYTPLPVTTTTTTTAAKTANTNTNTNIDGNTNANTTTTTTTTTKLVQLHRGYVSYFDPLHKVYTKRSNTFSAMEYIPDDLGLRRNKRYEADGFSSIVGGGCTLMEEVRCCSIASNFGEMRMQITCPVVNNMSMNNVMNNNSSTSNGIKELWKNDLLKCSSGDVEKYIEEDGVSNTTSNSKRDVFVELNGGELELEIKRQCVQRSEGRRDERINLIASRLACSDLSAPSSSSSSSAETGTTSSNGATNTAANVNTNTNATPNNNTKPKKKGSISNNAKKGQFIGIKLVIDFCMDPIDEGSNHFGGIHFHSPPSSQPQPVSPPNINSTETTVTTTNQTPHVYTTSGISGDHCGPRCYIPTIDSSSIKHRFTHELTIKVTSHVKEGLWAAGCGEHYGVNGAAIHSIPRVPLKGNTNHHLSGSGGGGVNCADNINVISSGLDRCLSPEEGEKKIKEEKLMKGILGRNSVDFIAKSFAPSLSTSLSTTSMSGSNLPVHIIPVDESAAAVPNYQLVTSVWTTSIWSPCPVRSIGFAIGPFKVLYDPEYYGKQDDDDDDEDEEEDGGKKSGDKKSHEDDEDEDGYPTISETAMVTGEGIRQLYFAPSDERCYIHSEVAVITSEGLVSPSSNQNDDYDLLDPVTVIKPSSSSVRQQKKKTVMSVMGATAGVANRALSLMRDVLALPSYRTTSYTQIWIPHAVDGGSSCGALHSCPDILCNPFLGGTC